MGVVFDVLVCAVYVVWILGVTRAVQLPAASLVVLPTTLSTFSSNWRAMIVTGSPALPEDTRPVRRTL